MLRTIHKFCKYGYSLSRNTCYLTDNNLPLLSHPSRLLTNLKKNSQTRKFHTKGMALFASSDSPCDSGGSFAEDDSVLLSPEVDRPSTVGQHQFWERGMDDVPDSDTASMQFRVVSYNVLSQPLLEAHPQLYQRCDKKYLAWSWRRRRLLAQLRLAAADVVCLQEVELDFYETLVPRMSGFVSVFAKKRGKSEGCAILYRESKFDLVEHTFVEFQQAHMPLLDRDNVAVLVKLLPKTRPEYGPIVAGTTHLLFNRRREDVRLAQVKVLLAELDRFAYDGRTRRHSPIVLTGDFNATPTSRVVRAVAEGFAKEFAPRKGRPPADWRRVSITDDCRHFGVLVNRGPGCAATSFALTRINHSAHPVNNPDGRALPQAAALAALFNRGCLRHALRLRSAYGLHALSGERATTRHDAWVVVDYVFFSQASGLRLTERLRLPTVAECQAAALPDKQHPSDHFLVGATFRLSRPTQSRGA